MSKDNDNELFCTRCGVGPAKKCSWRSTSHQAPASSVILCDDCEGIVRGIIATAIPGSVIKDACQRCVEGDAAKFHSMVWFVGDEQCKNRIVSVTTCEHCATLVQCIIITFAKLRSPSALSAQLLTLEGRKRFQHPSVM